MAVIAVGREVSSVLRPRNPGGEAAAGDWPAEVQAAIAGRDSALVRSFAKTLLALRQSDSFDRLLVALARIGWSKGEVETLRLIGCYYRGQHSQAIAAVDMLADRGVDADVDADLLIAAASALYHGGRAQDAHALLTASDRHKLAYATHADGPMTLAAVCWALGRFPEMKAAIDQARTMHPDSTAVAMNACAMFFELGDIAATEDILRQFDGGRYDASAACGVLGPIKLAQGNYREGFGILEQGFRNDAASYARRGLPPESRWYGQDLAGAPLLVVAERGLGDVVQMLRFIPMLASRGAGEVFVEVPEGMVSLLAYSFPGMRFLVSGASRPPACAVARWVSVMGLPHALGIEAGDVPMRSGYLRVPEESTAYWSSRIAGLSSPTRPRIGLAWSGQTMHRANLRRSIPRDLMMERIRGVAADFFAVQMQVGEERPANLHDLSEEILTLADTAALVAEMDLVITVDTLAVHLAGAIGVAAWLLLPYRYEWRWGLEGEGNHWYDSVRVLRQHDAGDWTDLLDEVFGKRLPDWMALARRR